MLTPGDVRDIYLTCRNDDPNGLIALDVDLLEFTRKIEQVLHVRLSTGEKWPADFAIPRRK